MSEASQDLWDDAIGWQRSSPALDPNSPQARLARFCPVSASDSRHPPQRIMRNGVSLESPVESPHTHVVGRLYRCTCQQSRVAAETLWSDHERLTSPDPSVLLLGYAPVPTRFFCGEASCNPGSAYLEYFKRHPYPRFAISIAFRGHLCTISTSLPLSLNRHGRVCKSSRGQAYAA